uniref:Uncharacterized protein n=1 Tax=Anguilla anguilla TaxID=7936 RepID=A0A0E9V9Q8_ANGAN
MSGSQLIKKARMNLMTSKVTSRLMGIRLLKRMMKVRKLNPKLAAPPSAILWWDGGGEGVGSWLES